MRTVKLQLKKLKQLKPVVGKAKEQQELGGQVDNCVIYEMFVYHLIDDDKELEKIRHDCLDGSLRCGDCKAKASELMVEMFDEIHDRQDEAREIANNLI